MTPALRLKLVRQFALSEVDYREHQWRLGLLLAAQEKRALSPQEQIQLEHEQAAISPDDALFAVWKAQLVADGVDLKAHEFKVLRLQTLQAHRKERAAVVTEIEGIRGKLLTKRIVTEPKDEDEITFGEREVEDAHHRAHLVERQRMRQHVADALKEDSPWVR